MLYGENLNIRIGLKTVSAYFEHKIIKTHPRHYDRGQWITDQKDYPEAALHYLEKTPEVCLETAKAIGPGAHQMVQFALEPFTRTGLRKAQGILRLTDKYSNERLELACLRAISYDNYDYKSLSNILQNNLEKVAKPSVTTTPPPSSPVLKLYTNSYVRPSDEYVSNMEVNYASK